MAIVKNSFKVSRLDGDSSPGSRGSVSSEDDDDEVRTRSSASDTDVSDVSDVDSGMGSDELDISEVGEAGTEFCQVGNQSCSIPLELYEFPDLGAVLSLETWNECLTEEERFALAEYLPDMDQETFGRTLKELFSGQNFHFGNPLVELFNRLKGGLCDPRIVLYRRGVNFLQRREHYHHLRKYQNAMVGSLIRIRDAWQNCGGYGIEERLRLLNILRSQRPLHYERDGEMGSETDSESGDSGDHHWTRRFKMDRRAVLPSRPSFDILSHGSGMPMEQMNFGKENSKGVLKVAAPKVSAPKEYFGVAGQYPSAAKHSVEAKTRPPKTLLALPRLDQVAGYDLGNSQRARHQMSGDEDDLEEQGYEMGLQGDWNAVRGNAPARANLLKPGKQELLKRYGRGIFDDDVPEGYDGLSYYQGRSRNSDQVVTIASYNHQSLETIKKAKYTEEWAHPARERPYNQALKGSQVDRLAGSQPFRHKKMLEAISVDRGKKWKVADEYKIGKSKAGYDSKVKSYKTIPAQMDDSCFLSDLRAKTLQGKIKNKSARYEEMSMGYARGATMYAQSEETESDSSDQVEEDGGIDPSVRKLGHLSGDVEVHRPGVIKSLYDSKKANKLAKMDKKAYSHFPDGATSIYTREEEPYRTKGKEKGKTNDPNYLNDVKLLKKGQVPQSKERLQPPLPKTYNTEKKHIGMIDLDNSSPQPNYLRDYGSGMLDEQEENLDGGSKLPGGRMQVNKSGNRNQPTDAEADCHERSNMSLLGCNTVKKKPKVKPERMYVDKPDEPLYQHSSPKQQIDDQSVMKKKGKRKADAASDCLTVATPEPTILDKGTADVGPEGKLQKKPFTLITPTIHTGFSFSIIHLLSAVRKAMITPNTEDSAVMAKHHEKNDGRPKLMRGEQSNLRQVANGTQMPHSHEKMDGHTLEHAGQNNLPSLTVQEIVNRVRSNPGDPCILETQEPLQDLVRGVLKIFSSKTAPLGAKGWKVLVFYEKSNKSWMWVGPVIAGSSDSDAVEEETSAEAWGIPHKMLVKLVDAFANWLKSGQETLQQIGSLPAPPISILSNLDEKERFKDLRAQKSLSTISPSSDEMRAYFRKEELLRYSIPDRAFSYTASDGKKSIVAPLRRGGGKPTSKARDHFMLKPDRPPHVTILCLVRDAAARLPGSIGTRADVCTLIRDSQYIVEDVSDAQVNQVVSGALDRLHYERDPCVQFDGDRKLWVYLHRDREEEDFEDDGTSSTKKWKRQRKDATDQSEMGAVNDGSYHATGDPNVGGSTAGYDYDPDPNIEPSSIKAGETSELVYNDSRPDMENIQSFVDSKPGTRNQGSSLSWEALGMNPLREDKMLCQENSTNEDFDDEAFSREKPVGLMSTGLF
uniref:Uncharacterized protein LOC105044531 n=1 Tax=Elaeis guineensis var. tenera TaxID=51953 RepID=A0A8N4IDU2_ELAGV|nr:uncharacterized protein LOC105044531 [Elaeis guineensis]XP_029120270.1 uncharacterized protein LOC105044531 [Elaeis guineensis]